MKRTSIAALFFAAALSGASANSTEPEPPPSQLQPVAPQAAGDALKGLYRVSGVTDGSPTAPGTVLSCTSFSSVAERIGISIYSRTGAIVFNAAYRMPARYTFTFVTSPILDYAANVNMNVRFNGGFAIIAGTSLQISCSASVVARSTPAGAGYALHMVRLNPAPGTSE